MAGRVQGSVYGPISKDCRVEGSSQVWINCPLPDFHPDLNDGVLKIMEMNQGLSSSDSVF